jgi:hypothetical protein
MMIPVDAYANAEAPKQFRAVRAAENGDTISEYNEESRKRARE